MAPMWEAMGRPLLPQLAKGFAGQLKAEIEKTEAAAPQPEPSVRRSFGEALAQWLRSVWLGVSGSQAGRATRP